MYQEDIEQSSLQSLWYNVSMANSGVGKNFKKLALAVGDISQTDKVVVSYDGDRLQGKQYEIKCLKCGMVKFGTVRYFNLKCGKCSVDRKNKRILVIGSISNTNRRVVAYNNLEKRYRKYEFECMACHDIIFGPANAFLRACNKCSHPKTVNPVSLEESLYYIYFRGAIDRGHEFGLSLALFLEIIKRDCFYCGVAPSGIYARKRLRDNIIYYNGVDRVDNSAGYVDDNVVSCCSTCNKMKGTLSSKRFKEQIVACYERINNGVW